MLKVVVDIDLHSMEPTLFKIYFVFNRRKKRIQVCNNLRMSKLWQFLGVNYPFKEILHGGLETLVLEWLEIAF